MKRTVRTVATALVAGALILSSAACSGGDAAGSDAPVTIRFSWWGSDTRAKKQQEVIDLFEQQHPNITVETETSNYDDYITKLSTAAASGTLPDVLTMIDPFMYDYIDSGSLLDLTTVSDQLDLSRFPDETFSDIVGDGGEKYGVSLGLSGHGIVVNPEVFKKYGVEIPDDETWSWEDFEQAAQEIAEKSDGEAVGFNIEPTEQIATLWIRQHNQNFGPAADGQTPVSFDAATIADYWTFEKKLIDAGATNTPDQAQELFAAGNSPEQQPISQDKAAMSMISMNQLAQFEDGAGHELQPVLWPGETQAANHGGWTKQGTYLSISAGTEHPEAAAELVDFLANNEEAATIMGLDRGIPANTEVAAALQAELTGADQRFAEWVERSQQVNTQPYYGMNSGVASVLTDAYTRAHESVIFGAATPQQAAESFKKELEQAAIN